MFILTHATALKPFHSKPSNPLHHLQNYNTIDRDQFEIVTVGVFLRSGVGAVSRLLIAAQIRLDTKVGTM